MSINAEKKLLALEINKNRADVPAMQAVVEFQHKGEYGNYTTHKYNYVYDAFIDESTCEKTLIVDMFKPAPTAEFLYRLFIGKTSKVMINGSSLNQTAQSAKAVCQLIITTIESIIRSLLKQIRSLTIIWRTQALMQKEKALKNNCLAKCSKTKTTQR